MRKQSKHDHENQRKATNEKGIELQTKKTNWKRNNKQYCFQERKQHYYVQLWKTENNHPPVENISSHRPTLVQMMTVCDTDLGFCYFY